MDSPPLIRDEEIFLRMNLAERVQHWLLISTFLLLIVTGLPLFFYEVKFFKWLLPSGRSFYVRGVIHRIAAVLMIANLIWHLFYPALTRRGRNNLKEMLPRWQDVKDAIELFGYNVGLTLFHYHRGM